jgi:hypothetical protein
VVQTLATHAPTWLVQFPALVTPEHRTTLQRELLGATRARMLRELNAALETLTATSPLLRIGKINGLLVPPRSTSPARRLGGSRAGGWVRCAGESALGWCWPGGAGWERDALQEFPGV